MNFISLHYFSSLPEAELALNRLKEEEIRCFLQKDGIAGTISLIEGAELFVEEKDIDRVRMILFGN